MADEVKICTKCEKELPLSHYNADSRRKDGKRASCKDCDAQQKKAIREANLDKYRRMNAERNRELRERRKGGS
jgi:hypothetical protein